MTTCYLCHFKQLDDVLKATRHPVLDKAICDGVALRVMELWKV